MSSKKCYKCEEVKDLSEFNKDKSRKDGHQSRCRKCSNEITNIHYYDNKEVYYKRSRKLNDERVIISQNYICEYLLEHPCVDCSEYNIVVLEFDHVIGSKDNNICYMILHGYAISTLKTEIEKCVVRCANCHRRKTAKDLNYNSSIYNTSTKGYKYVKEYLANNSCIDCGESDIIVLEFDHINPENKIDSICNMIGNHRPLEIIKREIEKCEVRCANCHRIKTAKDFTYQKYEYMKNKNGASD